MMRGKRAAALLLCVGLVIALAVSSVYIAHEAGHDCSGEDCPICQTIAISVSLLRTVGLAALTLLVFFALPRAGSVVRIQPFLTIPVSPTLVSWKIRLND